MSKEYVYVNIEGATQGAFAPGMPVGNTTESIAGEDVSADMETWDWVSRTTTGYEATTGYATGARTHEPVRFKTRACQAYPLLVNAIKDNENLTIITKMFRTKTDGGRELLATINYANCRLVELGLASSDFAAGGYEQGAHHAAAEGLGSFVKVGFTYQDVNVEFSGEGGSTSGEDHWKTTT